MNYITLSRRHRLYIDWYVSMNNETQNSTLGVWVLGLIVNVNSQLKDIEFNTSRCNKRCMYGNYTGRL